MYLDESGFAQDAPRPRGYSLKGQRCYGRHDGYAKGRINALGALLGTALLTVSLVEGYVNADVFLAWVEQDLLPKLPAEAVVVMDNAAFHKRADIVAAIQAHATLEFLPSYSPDLNPIEHKWAQAKLLRQRYRCDVDALFAQHLNYVTL